MLSPTGAPSVTFRLRSLAPVLSLLATIGCNVIPNGLSSARDLAVVPGAVTVHAGQTARFAAKVTGASDNDVVWSLASQSPQLGNISRAGIYQAPAGLTRSIRVSVVASSAADPTRIATATVTVTPLSAVSMIVLPQAITLQAGGSQQFIARVGGTSNSDVTWSLSSNSSPAGNISSTGLYTAPADVYSAMQVMVTATSVADPAVSASAFFTVNPLANVHVTVTPPGATLLAGGTQQLTATVSGSSNNNVTWSLTSTVSQPGYVSQSGLYMAPSSLNSTILAVVTATSVADPTRSASALLTVNPADSVHVSVTPSSASLLAGGVQLLYPNVTGTNNRGVTWSLTSSAAQPGSISSLGLYTAPSAVNNSIQVTATATSMADPTQSASALLTVNPVASVHISVTPPSETLPSGGTQQFSANVTGTSNTAATWNISPQIGSLSTSGFYTAPSGLTSNAQVSIVATSLADPTQSATAVVSLLAAPTVKITISPASFSMASGSIEQFDATVTGTTNTGVTWGASLGSISAGLYTAPVTGVQENATVTATSVLDPTQTATATIVVMPQSSSGSGVPASFFGMHVNKTTSPWPTVPFASYRSLDSSYIKWADINTGDQTYDWTNFDKWMNRAESNGQDIMYTLFTTPSWASTRGRHTSSPNYACVYADVAGPGACDPPNDLFPDGSGTDKHWKDFITAVMNHVGPGKIKYWEVWNEFNNSIEWTGTQAQMLRMAKDAYTIVKAMDTNALVTTPSVASPIFGVDNWVAPYLQAGGGDYADIIAIHGYVHSSTTVCPSACPDPEIIASILNDMRAVMAANGQRNKPLFDTEGSWGQTTRMTDPDLQAAFTGRYFLIQAAGTPISKPFDKFYWYGWDFRQTGQFYSLRGGRLTPAGVAYQQLYSWVVGAAQTGCSKQGTQWTCPMTRSGYQAEAIWDSSQSCTYGNCSTLTVTVSPVYTQYRDLAGNVTTISNNTVPVGLKPILLESGNAP